MARILYTSPSPHSADINGEPVTFSKNRTYELPLDHPHVVMLLARGWAEELPAKTANAPAAAPRKNSNSKNS